MSTAKLTVLGMSCDHCRKAITNGLLELGVSEISVDLDTRAVTVEYEPTQTSLDAIKSEIDEMGYEVEA